MHLPSRRPTGLRLTSLGGSWWRIDRDSPDRWAWEPFATPLHRFDSAGGRVRVRYAGRTFVGAVRERYRDTGSFVPADHAGHWLVELTGRVRVLDLRSERTLDALGLHDRISTAHEPEIWSAAQRLTDRALDWWHDRIEGIVYRSRTTPETSANLASFPWPTFEIHGVKLQDARDRLDELVVVHGFTIDF